MSTPHNKLIGLRDLLQNKALASVLPQFPKSMPLQNVYSYAKVEEMVAKYIVKLLNNSTYKDGEIIAKGKHETVLQQVRNAVPTIEAFFNSMPSIAKNIRRNTKLYLPYNTIGQIANLDTIQAKTKLMKEILDNIAYNPDFNTVQKIPDVKAFAREQERWKRNVGYTERI